MIRKKHLLLGLIFLLAFAWVGLMALVVSFSGKLREEAALSRQGSFTDDGSLVAEVTSVSRENFKITMTVKLTDSAGKVIDGRAQGDFDVLEDGVPVELSTFMSAGQAPIRMCLVIDYSNSMAGPRIANARAAALKLLGMMRDDWDHLGLYLFNGPLAKTGKQEVLALGPLTPKRRELARAAIEDTPLHAGTPMFRTMKMAFASMENQTGRRVMVLLGDGADTDYRKLIGAEPALKELAETSEKQEVPIYVVSLEGNTGSAFMNKIARGVKGRFIDAQNPEDLEGIYSGIGYSLLNEYVLEFDSPNPIEDGTTRSIVVAVRQGDKGTRANGSYRVPGVTSTGAGTARPRSSDAEGTGSADAQPFWTIVISLGTPLVLLFVLPYLRGTHAAEPATPTPAATPLAVKLDPVAPSAPAKTPNAAATPAAKRPTVSGGSAAKKPGSPPPPKSPPGKK